MVCYGCFRRMLGFGCLPWQAMNSSSENFLHELRKTDVPIRDMSHSNHESLLNENHMVLIFYHLWVVICDQ